MYAAFSQGLGLILSKTGTNSLVK